MRACSVIPCSFLLSKANAEEVKEEGRARASGEINKLSGYNGIRGTGTR